MHENGDSCNNEVARAMTQAMLQDILNSVIEEFEKRTDSRMGAITISPPQGKRHQRIITAEISHTGERCITGLAQYRRILCDHKPFRDMPICSAPE
jgi:hypothetical protein